MLEGDAVDLIAAVGAAAVVLLLAGVQYRSTTSPDGTQWWHAAWVIAVPAGVVVVVTPSSVVLVVGGAGAAAAIWGLVEKRRAYARARHTSQAVHDACSDLADDLQMGRIPQEALSAAARRWPPLRPVAVAGDLHHDVDQALREVAQTPGAAGLRDVAAAWQVSTRMGSGLADALAQVARILAARERQKRLVEAELGAARATAAMVSGLPVLVLAMGAGLGVHPWLFFLRGLGSVMAVLGVGLLIAGWAWIDRLAHHAVGTS